MKKKDLALCLSIAMTKGCNTMNIWLPGFQSSIKAPINSIILRGEIIEYKDIHKLDFIPIDKIIHFSFD